MSKVYVEGYAEFWTGFALAGDPEVMYSALGLFNNGLSPNDWDQSSIDTVMTIMYDALGSLVPNAYTVQSGFALVGLGTTPTDDDPPLKITTTIAPQAGTHTGSSSALPQNCAYLVHKNVAFGRPGRMFIPGPQDDLVSNAGVISNTEISIVTTMLTTLKADLEAVTVGGLNPILAIMSKNRAPVAGYAVKEVSSLTLDPRIGTQRRRLRR